MYDGKLDFSGFQCDHPVLNEYLHTVAKLEHDVDHCRLYFVVDGNSQIGGFYTVNNGSVSKADQMPPGSGKRNYPYRQIGSVHIGRLARHQALVGIKLGTTIMHSALETAVEVSNRSAAPLVTVDAKDQRAFDFYMGFGFKELLQAAGAASFPKPLYLKIKDARLIVSPV